MKLHHYHSLPLPPLGTPISITAAAAVSCRRYDDEPYLHIAAFKNMGNY